MSMLNPFMCLPNDLKIKIIGLALDQKRDPMALEYWSQLQRTRETHQAVLKLRDEKIARRRKNQQQLGSLEHFGKGIYENIDENECLFGLIKELGDIFETWKTGLNLKPTRVMKWSQCPSYEDYDPDDPYYN
jgi:hypothetical protein